MSDRRHGRLDDDAAARLNDLIALARAHGHGTSPGLLMSNAVRILHALATGKAALVVEGGAHDLPVVGEAEGDSPMVRH